MTVIRTQKDPDYKYPGQLKIEERWVYDRRSNLKEGKLNVSDAQTKSASKSYA